MRTSAQEPYPIFMAGQWRPARWAGEFSAVNPATQQPIAGRYPISSWEDCAAALAAAEAAFAALRDRPSDLAPAFLENYAAQIEAHAAALCAMAHDETALPVRPRLQDVELPRTVNQLRQAAAAARDGTWALPVIDTKFNLCSCLGPIGPVLTMGPNNFPMAYNAIAGGDFASAIAAGNPVIAKAHPSHPGTTRLLAELAAAALAETGMPAGAVQLLYHLSPQDGLKLVADPRLKAVGFTGSRAGGLKLKAAADAAGKPFYGEMSSTNPVVILPGALRERMDDIVKQFVASALAAAGQFCTNPGLVVLLEGSESREFMAQVQARFAAAPVGTLLSEGVEKSLEAGVQDLIGAGAELVVGGKAGGGIGYSYANTLLRVSGTQFLAQPQALQREAFGNAALLVLAANLEEVARVLETLEGNLTGALYTHTAGDDDDAYARLAPILRARVGRLLNDKMPTGVVVSPAMNHGGPYPATSHPHFTAVGFPAAMRRFTALQCYDNVREPRLPASLRNKNPSGVTWRLIDGQWTQGDASC